MADGRTIIPDLPEATDAQMTDGALTTVWTQEQSSSSGFVTKKSPLSKLANYVLNKFNALQLGGTTRTVKAAIDAVATLLGSSSMGTTATTVTGAIAEHEGDINYISAWNYTDGTLSSLSQFTAFIDNIYTARGAQGFHFGYIQAADSANIGLQNTGHYFMVFSNSANYRLVITITTTGLRWDALYKSSGTWQSTWSTIVTP